MRTALAIIAALAFFGAGFFTAAIVASKGLAEWRDRFCRLRALAAQAGAEIPSWALFAEGRLINAKTTPAIKRTRLPKAVLASLVPMAAAGVLVTIFRKACQTATPTQDLIYHAGVVGILTIIGAASVWSTWPRPAPKITAAFLERWAEQFPVFYITKAEQPEYAPEVHRRAVAFCTQMAAALGHKVNRPAEDKPTDL